ncbi:MAG: SDR family oxidoreductase [Pirellulales bacterium]
MANSLHGRVALVTGATRGLGRAMAFTLGRAGAKVAINFQNDAELAQRTWDEYASAGLQGMLVRGDVASETGVDEIVAAVKTQLGPVEILVLNATPAQPQLPIEEYTWGHYQRMLDFFVKSPFLLTKACLPEMKARRWGRVINIGSEVFQRGVGNFSAYVSAKGGQAGFTRSMATELAPFGITVNLIAPGWIPVERHAADPPEMKAAYRALIPAGRWGTPQDVADAVLFFAGDGSAFVTGQTLCVNGGMTPL